MSEYTLDDAIEISNKITGAISVLISRVVAFAIGVILIKLLWAWTIRELFPMAVDQGLIVSDMTWPVALRIVALVAILASTGSLIAGRWGR